MVTELNISMLYGSEKDRTSCQGRHSHDSNREKLATLLGTARETSARYFVSCHGRSAGPIYGTKASVKMPHPFVNERAEASFQPP